MENIAQSRNIYQVKNERMGGFVPSWDAPKQTDFDKILSPYSSMPEQVEIFPPAKDNKLGLLDIIDMFNPLQHIPLVNMAYRALTGDEIKPVSKIIGGGVFGGVAGMASSIINVVIEEETGKDIIGNVASLVGIGDEKAKEFEAYKDLPASLLAFAEMPMISLEEQEQGYREINESAIS